ncbi:MAG: serine hydrolase domain-containing protein [Flavobacterium circumlabens]|uniref:serine hydrolase domain-containing protein n=1 Tax=Flavobacterium circumlabens TaxID=2133765 RepID=UPI00326424A2
MTKIIKNTVAVLILISTTNLWAQKVKQEIMYREDSKFIQPTLSEDLIIPILSAEKVKVSKVDAALKDMIQKNNIIGLQLAIVSNNKIVKTMNYGLANIQDSVWVDSKTVFSINSMTKAFTGVALMQLAEEGKLNLDDPISKYLDSLPNSWKNITIKQLAGHTSGIPDIWNSERNMITENNQIALKKIKELPIVFQPGERFGYNQTNYLLLGMLIEKISGKSFEKYLTENQFNKVGMKNSAKAGLADYYKVVQHSARSYTHFRNGSLTNMYEEIPENLRTAAGIYSTATEIAEWIIALQSRQLVKEEKNLEALWTPMVLTNGKTQGMSDFLNGYAIGFYTSSGTGNSVIASLGGLRSGMYIYPKDNISVIILTNSQGFHPEDYLEQIACLYRTENK